MHNLHISLTEFRNESRALKETASLLEHGRVQSVAIAALHADGLAERETLGPRRELYRLRIKSRSLPARLPFQILKFAEFCARVLGLAMRQRPQVVNVHTLALLPLGVFLKLLFRARLVYDAHELETEVEGLRGLRQNLSRMVERLCMPAVDLTITVGPMIRDWYRERYQIENVVAVLNCPVFKVVERRGRLREELGISPEQKICLYQGALCSGRGIELLLESFELMDDNNVVLVCMGYGELEYLVKDAANRCSRIHYFPAVPPALVLEYTVDADIGFALIENTCLSYYLCLPNKLFEYAMAGVPVISSPLPEMRALMVEYRIGAVISDSTPTAVEHAVQEINTFDRDALRQHLAEFTRRFCWQEQEAVMMDAYQQHIFR
ncbi:glycosyltransferase [Herbaspirillum seropedicae]|uniref:glycosyltransferase n=1 Tax=Herbaspirillum seropedicae TaxID=964 RepID=UPI003FCED213